jgi:hypothetical protein
MAWVMVLETDKVFAGSVPENYDRYMVPLIFEPFGSSDQLRDRCIPINGSNTRFDGLAIISGRRQRKRISSARSRLRAVSRRNPGNSAPP